MITLGEGTTIGAYQIVRKIGEGGMGAVYLAEHTLLGRPAAIKLLLPALSSQREVVDRFFNEARATTSVNDPGIVQVFDFGVHTDGSAYIVMELLEGESLDARIHRGAIAVVDALRITRQVAASLAAAHARGIVHRDLKPDNLFMVRDAEAQGGERPKILDFGIAKLTSDGPDRSRTRTGTILGTPIYMSPEQCRGSGVVDHRADVYSLGCVLYHLLTGKPPFDLEGMGEIISAHLREAPRPPSALAAGIAPGVDELVLRCLAKAPDERFSSMVELQAACEAQLARLSGAGAQTFALPGGMAAGYLSGVTPPAMPGASTTLGSAAAEATAAPRRRAAAWLAPALVLVAGGAIAIAVAVRGGGGGSQAIAPAAGAPRAATGALPAPAPDAALAATTPPADAAPVAAAPPADAAPVAAAPPIDAGAVATTPPRPAGHAPHHPRRPAHARASHPTAPETNAYDSR